MRWKLMVLVLLVAAIAPEPFVHFAGASVRAALQVVGGMLSPASAGPGHG
jgi:hypothetical protein